jgi:hypothetical protein
VIRFKDFTMFNVLMTRPDPEFDIAFLMLDTKRKGYVTLNDIKVTLALTAHLLAPVARVASCF